MLTQITFCPFQATLDLSQSDAQVYVNIDLTSLLYSMGINDDRTKI